MCVAYRKMPRRDLCVWSASSMRLCRPTLPRTTHREDAGMAQSPAGHTPGRTRHPGGWSPWGFTATGGRFAQQPRRVLRVGGRVSDRTQTAIARYQRCRLDGG